MHSSNCSTRIIRLRVEEKLKLNLGTRHEAGIHTGWPFCLRTHVHIHTTGSSVTISHTLACFMGKEGNQKTHTEKSLGSNQGP